MKRIFQFIGLSVVLLFVISCSRENDEINEKQTNQEYVESSNNKKGAVGLNIILGNKLDLAYDVNNMQDAVDYINEYSNITSYADRIIEPSHFYIKFTPTNEDHLTILEYIENTNDEIVLSSYPLDYEIIQEGSFLEQNDPNVIKYAELYTTVPVNYSFPNVPYQIINEVYEPEEIEEDLEYTALILTGNGKDIDYTYNGTPLTRRNLIDYLNSNERGGKYTPKGQFVVYNTHTSSYVGVMYTKISIGRGIWWRYTYTNSTGNFVSPKKYRGKVKIRAKWKSESATIRKHWNEVIGIGVSDYLMYIKKNYNNRIYFTLHSDNHKWYKATIQNSIIKYNAYMEPKGVTGIHNANIWVSEGNYFMASTLMMKQYTWSTTYNAILAGWLPWLSPISFPITTVINALFGHLYPDVVFSLNNKNTKKIDQIVFHEVGHFSHAKKAGGSYWGVVVNRELDNILDCGGDPYCDGDDPSEWSGQLIALAEGWATFTEYKTMDGYYSTAWNGENPSTYMEAFDMYGVPHEIIDDNDSWFLTGLIWDVIDNHTESGTFLYDIYRENRIIDNLHLGNIDSDFSPVYNRLLNSVDNGNDLKIALRNTYPSSTNQINELFNSYGYKIP